MAVINTQHKWLYLMEPHTASRCMSDFLKKELGGSEIGHHHISVDHLTDRARQHISPNQLKGFRILCTIRNPLDVLVTRWKFQGKGGMDKPRAEAIARHRGVTLDEVLDQYNQEGYINFDAWVYSIQDRPGRMIPMRGLYDECTQYLYYEHLAEDMTTTFGRALELRRTSDSHITPGKEPWWTYYMRDGEVDHNLLNVILEKFQPFLSRFGYSYQEKEGRLHCHVNPFVRERLVKSL